MCLCVYTCMSFCSFFFSAFSIISIGAVKYARDESTFVVMKDLFDHVQRVTRHTYTHTNKMKEKPKIPWNSVKKAHLTYAMAHLCIQAIMELLRGASIIFACFTIFSLRAFCYFHGKNKQFNKTHTHIRQLHLISRVFWVIKMQKKYHRQQQKTGWR